MYSSDGEVIDCRMSSGDALLLASSDIKPSKYGNIIVQLLDFGGQEVVYSRGYTDMHGNIHVDAFLSIFDSAFSMSGLLSIQNQFKMSFETTASVANRNQRIMDGVRGDAIIAFFCLSQALLIELAAEAAAAANDGTDGT